MRDITFGYRQQGAALLVSLIILLVLSIIGISAMRGGLLQSLIAANSQQSEMAFSAADAGASATIYTASQQGVAEGGILASATAAAGATVSLEVDSAGNAATAAGDVAFLDAGRATPITTATTTVAWQGCTASCPGYSMRVGDTNRPGCHSFEIDSTGSVGDTSTQVQQVANTVAAPCVE